MSKPVNMISSEQNSGLSTSKRMKTFLFLIQIFFIATILVLWYTSQSLRESKNLWMLLIYAVPANFITGIVPYDPAVIYYAKYHSMLIVLLVGVASILFVEGINYSVLKTMINTRFLLKVHHHQLIKKVIRLFDRRPFLALSIAGFFPFPFYPFRMLVILSGYPLIKYLLSILLSRIPRLFFLVLLYFA